MVTFLSGAIDDSYSPAWHGLLAGVRWLTDNVIFSVAQSPQDLIAYVLEKAILLHFSIPFLKMKGNCPLPGLSDSFDQSQGVLHNRFSSLDFLIHAHIRSKC